MAYPVTIPRLASSRSKAEFLERLGMTETDTNHRRLYEAMKDDCIAGRDRLQSDGMNLVPQFRDDPNVRPPYASNQISETAMFREVHTIYERAGPWTKAMYNRGWFSDGPNMDNWIIRWVLWHVFRYRDNRNKNRWSGSSTGATQANDVSTSKRASPVDSPEKSPEQTKSEPTQSPGHSGWWDPVRSQWTHGTTTTA